MLLKNGSSENCCRWAETVKKNGNVQGVSSCRRAPSKREISSRTLRKYSSCLPSIQVTDPCQLAFWRNRIRREKVAAVPRWLSSRAAVETKALEGIWNFLSSVKD